MQGKALASAPKLVLVMMKDAFYQQLELPHLPLPIPVADTETILQRDQWTVSELLEHLRYYLLTNTDETPKYAPIAVRLAYEMGVHEGVQGDIDKADYYFGLAKDYGPRSLTVTANVAYGYLKSRDYDNALKEFEQARKLLVKAEAFMPAIWLNIANLHFFLGSKVKGKNVMQDYIAKAELLPGDLPVKLIEYAFKWVAKYKAEKGLIEILMDHTDKDNSPGIKRVN
jgi:tetratricopeptide (TPR) repeat protein